MAAMHDPGSPEEIQERGGERLRGRTPLSDRSTTAKAPMVREPQSAKYRRTRLSANPGRESQGRVALGIPVELADPVRAAPGGFRRLGCPPARHRPRQPRGGVLKPGVLRSPALPQDARAVQRSRIARARQPPRSRRQGRALHRLRAGNTLEGIRFQSMEEAQTSLYWWSAGPTRAFTTRKNPGWAQTIHLDLCCKLHAEGVHRGMEVVRGWWPGLHGWILAMARS